jgi:hypothetical protein
MAYKLREEHGEPVPCDSCDYPAPTSEFDWGPPFTETHARPHRLLCQFCATTMAGRHTRYETRMDGATLLQRAETWRAAANVYNMLKHPPHD